MRISTNGNVGIGTTAPGNLLELYKSLASSTTLQPLLALNSDFNSGVGTGFGSAIVFRGRTAGNVVRDNAQIAAYNEDVNDNGYALGFYTSPTASTGLQQRVTILRGGNVGIGTTTPGYPLTVNGAVRAKEVIVDTGWSDYVFKPDYRLASLSEVEGVIKKDGHLPGIPSEQEVTEKGISVGQMQAKLLAKIEELTLHQIQQEKQLKQQAAEFSARIQRLENENTTLRSQDHQP